MIGTLPCPKCGRSLQRSGEVSVEGVAFLVLQCDECIGPWEVEGDVFDTAFTFAVDAEGRLFEPDEGKLPL